MNKNPYIQMLKSKIEKNTRRQKAGIGESDRSSNKKTGETLLQENDSVRIQLAEALRESEERYRTLVELSPEGIAVVSDGKCVYMNPAGIHLMGASSLDEITGKKALDFIHPDYHEMIRQRLRHVEKENKKTPVREVKIRRLDGQVRDVETSSTPIAYRGKSAAQVVFRDITGRKRAEEKIDRLNQLLQRKVAELETILDTAPMGIAIASDPQCFNIKGNPALADMMGMTTADNLSKNAPEGQKPVSFRLMRNGRELNPDELPMKIAASKGTAVKNADLDIVRKDGRVIKILGNAAPLFDEYGKSRGAVGAFLDITELKKAEEAIRESEQKYRQLFTNLREAIVLFEVVRDADGRITDWIIRDINQTGIEGMGKPVEEFLGKRANEVIGEAVMAPYIDISRQVMASGKPARFETYFEYNNKYYLNSCFPLGKDFYVTASVDITERRQAEQALRESEERLRLATDVANEAIWDWDLVGGKVKWNNTFGILFGRPRDAGSSPQWWIDRIHPEDRDRVLSTIQDALGTDASSWAAEYRFLRPDGNWANVYDRALISRDESGKARRIVGAMLDVTEQRQAQKALQESHEELERRVQERTDELTKAYEFLKRIFASIDVHIAYIDRNFNFISVNRAYAENAKQTPELFVGKNYFALFPDQENERIVRRVAETGEPYVAYEKAFVDPRNPGGGKTYWDWSVQPIKDFDGNVTGLVLTSVNITERKRAEENIIRLAAAIESAADAIVITDVRGIISYVNPAFEKITGYSKNEVTGGTLHLLDSGKHDEAFFRELRETLKREGVWTGRLIQKKKDGTLYDEECTYSPIKNAAGEIINYVSIKRDVTEKLRLESIAHTLDNINNIGFIFSGVRHEIANPVNSANMILSVLKEKLEKLDKQTIEDYIDRSMGEISRVNYLLSTLRNFNMYEKPQMQNVPLKELLDNLVSLVKEDLRVRGIAIRASIEDGVDYCYGDPRALQQVLINLLSNATDALRGRDNPNIAVSVTGKNGTCRIRIQDNGIGMTEQQQTNLFKPFYTTKAKGTGLGLVIVKKMIIAMNGSLEISSRKDVGTSVDIMLPAGRECDKKK